MPQRTLLQHSLEMDALLDPIQSCMHQSAVTPGYDGRSDGRCILRAPHVMSWFCQLIAKTSANIKKKAKNMFFFSGGRAVLTSVCDHCPG